jgi:cupin superfamily acireductone dioxygenase involved in methionine salvage
MKPHHIFQWCKNKNAMLLIANSTSGARTNLAENDSVSQNEQESATFHNYMDQKLSERGLSPELLEANNMIEEKDREIKSLKNEVERISIEGGFKVCRALTDYVIRIAKEVKENNKENYYLYFIIQGFDVLRIVDHMPQSDEEIQNLLG